MKRIFIKETVSKVGEEVLISGWVNTRRDHGKIVFVDLRDMSGLIQIVFVPGSKAYEKITDVRPEWVISVTGKINARPDKMVNKDLVTGTTKKIDLPKSNVLQFLLEEGTLITVRPSGTEPKIKFYFGLKAELKSRAQFKEVSDKLKSKIERIKSSMGLI